MGTVSGEFVRIADIRRRLGDVGTDVVVGNGDDAAVLEGDGAPQVLSVDAMVEGVHFRPELLRPEDIGYRALCAALSDLAAMGAVPRAVLVAMIAPTTLADATLYAIADGVAEAQRDLGAPVIGGNLAAGRELSITTTVFGRGSGCALQRGGAKPGDDLYVTGRVGEAALGLQALLAGRPELAQDAVARWRRPAPRLQAGAALVDHASACVDISDGLLSDLGHLARASGVGFELELAQLPIADDASAAAAVLGQDMRRLALTGGEDYELLFTCADAPPPLEVECTRIGRAQPQPGLRLLDAAGQAVAPPGAAGFDHFG